MATMIMALVLVFWAGTSLSIDPSCEDSSSPSASRAVEAFNGVVASDDRRCSAIGRNFLRQGGNAVDATVATAVCEGVVNPMSSGIGGGAFLVLRLANGTAIAYDFREVAPKAASEELYRRDPSLKDTGPLSIGVPGEVAGLHMVWKKHGRLPWRDLFQPAIRLARHGFVVTRYFEDHVNVTLEAILGHEQLRKYLSPNGTLVRAGDVLRNPELASTLETIAEQGPGALYGGSLGARLVGDVQAAGGNLTVQDLEEYEVEVRQPTEVEVMGYKVLGMPPPSSGGATVSLALSILSNYEDLSTVSDGLYTHRLVEAMKHGYAVRMNLGDPAFVNVSAVLSDMLSPEFASTLHKAILDNTTFPPEHYGGKWKRPWKQLEDHGTCHFGVVDKERNAVAITTTVNSIFGSKIFSNSTGVLLNNEMGDFSIPTSNTTLAIPANFIEPKKRPLSSMSPTIVLKNDQVAAVVGASGGIEIITGTLQVFLNHFIRGLDPSTAVSKPRVHHQLVPNMVSCENWTTVTGKHIEVERSIRHALASRGHKVEENGGYCVTQLITQDVNSSFLHNSRGKLIGVSDYRKDGAPAGF